MCGFRESYARGIASENNQQRLPQEIRDLNSFGVLLPAMDARSVHGRYRVYRHTPAPWGGNTTGTVYMKFMGIFQVARSNASANSLHCDRTNRSSARVSRPRRSTTSTTVDYNCDNRNDVNSREVSEHE